MNRVRQSPSLHVTEVISGLLPAFANRLARFRRSRDVSAALSPMGGQQLSIAEVQALLANASELSVVQRRAVLTWFVEAVQMRLDAAEAQSFIQTLAALIPVLLATTRDERAPFLQLLRALRKSLKARVFAEFIPSWARFSGEERRSIRNSLTPRGGFSEDEYTFIFSRTPEVLSFAEQRRMKRLLGTTIIRHIDGTEYDGARFEPRDPDSDN